MKPTFEEQGPPVYAKKKKKKMEGNGKREYTFSFPGFYSVPKYLPQTFCPFPTQRQPMREVDIIFFFTPPIRKSLGGIF